MKATYEVWVMTGKVGEFTSKKEACRYAMRVSRRYGGWEGARVGVLRVVDGCGDINQCETVAVARQGGWEVSP